MPALHETFTQPEEDTIIEAYEREFTTHDPMLDAELARVTLENALFDEFGEYRDGAQVIPGDQ